MAIFYLDIDDEITSAAARIRGTADLVVVLVLPAGSRIATSRINFRLLAREAQQRSRRLSIVAPDAAARALAATAGLPVYGSTMEYEASLLPSLADGGAGAAASALPASSVPAAARPAAGAPAPAATPSVPRDATAPDAGRAFAPPAPHAGPARPGPTTGIGPERGRDPAPRSSHRRRNAAVIGLLVLAFVGVAGGAAAYLLLPTASIVLTIRSTPIPPVTFVVTADPDVTAPDAAAAVVPATRMDLPLTASGTFKASGKRVDEAPAVGTVRWTNCDPTRSYTIPGGTPVRTPAGIAFGTDEAVFLPVAILNPPRIACQDRTVTVTAAKTGTDANVAAGTITVIPGQYNSVVLSVTNPAPTSGGKRNSFPKVTQKDVTAALAALGKQLDAQLATAARRHGDRGPGHARRPGSRPVRPRGDGHRHRRDGGPGADRHARPGPRECRRPGGSRPGRGLTGRHGRARHRGRAAGAVRRDSPRGRGAARRRVGAPEAGGGPFRAGGPGDPGCLRGRDRHALAGLGDDDPDHRSAGRPARRRSGSSSP